MLMLFQSNVSKMEKDKSSDNELWMESVQSDSSRFRVQYPVGYPLQQPSQQPAVAVGTYRWLTCRESVGIATILGLSSVGIASYD